MKLSACLIKRSQFVLQTEKWMKEAHITIIPYCICILITATRISRIVSFVFSCFSSFEFYYIHIMTILWKNHIPNVRTKKSCLIELATLPQYPNEKEYFPCCSHLLLWLIIISQTKSQNNKLICQRWQKKHDDTFSDKWMCYFALSIWNVT